ncbi:hypothetical protein F8R90_04055 [Nostoc sp. NZL]|nr:hypothetical protein [Nostoc sp. NZL]
MRSARSVIPSKPNPRFRGCLKSLIYYSPWRLEVAATQTKPICVGSSPCFCVSPRRRTWFV